MNTFKKMGIIALIAVIGVLAMSCATAKIANVEWTALKGPKQARQYIGIDTKEVTVKVNYENGESKDVKVKSLEYDKDKVGVQTVTATFGKETGTFQTEVMELTGIRISQLPKKTIYYVDEKYNESGIKITAAWKNMPEQELSAGTMFLLFQSGFDSKTPAAKRDITYTYKGKTATFPITVIPALTAEQAASAFNPEANQPSPVGTWTFTSSVYNETFTINADGTSTFVSTAAVVAWRNYSSKLNWFVTGGNLMVRINQATGIATTYKYSIVGNKLTFLNPNGELVEYTRK